MPDIVDAADLDEEPLADESPRQVAKRLSEAKAMQVAARHSGCFVLAADTVVACGRRLLSKPHGIAEAGRMLRLLSGRRHRVYTAVSIIAPDRRRAERLVTTTVRFKRLSDAEVEDYLGMEEWRGKAGAYAIQGRAGGFAVWVNGSYSNVVGLPLCETEAALAGLGFRHVPSR